MDWESRSLHLSVGELASFRTGPTSGSGTRTGRWRAEAGQQWHTEARLRLEAAPPTETRLLFEQAVAGVRRVGDWTVHLQGRVDQILVSPEGVLVREVKTVSLPLPAEPEALAQTYPDHAGQLASYLCLLDAAYPTQARRGELLYIELESGLSQVVPLSEPAEALFQALLERLVGFVQSRWQSRKSWAASPWVPVFPVLREGQAEAAAALAQAGHSSAHLFFEAPTGFGKTGLALEYALRGLREHRWERVVYLSSKSTGQVPVLEHLSRMVTPGGLTYLQMRSREEHRLPEHEQRLWADPASRWTELGLDARQLLQQGTLPLAEVLALGESTGIEPYALSRALLPYADIWVGDLNYVFSPWHRSVFFDQPGFDPSRTLLIVDEAHNLPSRVADLWSPSWRLDNLRALRAGLAWSRFPRRLEVALEALEELLENVRPAERLDPDFEADWRRRLDAFAEALAYGWLDPEQLAPEVLEGLWELADSRLPWQQAGLETLFWSPQARSLSLSCLEAGPLIRASLLGFGQSLLMSATLQPLDSLSSALGLRPREYAFVLGEAPWRADAYRVAVDTRVDTRYQERDRSIHTTARTVCALASGAADPIVVFFPSYRYAATVAEACAFQDPGLRIAQQPRGLDLQGQQAFVEEALDQMHALFLVLGSGFSEGIDSLGGRVRRALVVGPALPEVNARQKARLEARRHLGRAQAFREVYQIPGLLRINQALGRLVRGPGQSASVLLHCRRFAEADYQSLLAPEYQTGEWVETDGDLEAWLRELPTVRH